MPSHVQHSASAHLWFHQVVSPSQAPSQQKMSVFLQITSRVEAAIEAYKSVKETANKQEWRANFEGKFVSVHLLFTQQSTTYHLK